MTTATLKAIGYKPKQPKGCTQFNLYCPAVIEGHCYEVRETLERGLILQDIGPYDKSGRKPGRFTAQRPGTRTVLTLSRSAVSKLEGHLQTFVEDLDFEVEGDRIYIDASNEIVKNVEEYAQTTKAANDALTGLEDFFRPNQNWSGVAATRPGNAAQAVDVQPQPQPPVQQPQSRAEALKAKPALTAKFLDDLMWAILSLDTLKRIGDVIVQDGDIAVLRSEENIEEAINRLDDFMENHPEYVTVDEDGTIGITIHV